MEQELTLSTACPIIEIIFIEISIGILNKTSIHNEISLKVFKIRDLNLEVKRGPALNNAFTEK
jgi:hypothetical protein